MNKKKTTAILSLSFALAFGGSTLPDNTADVNQKLNYNLDKLEAFSSCTDWTNPSEFLYGDEMFLGYDNQNYYYYTPKASKPNFNTQNQINNIGTKQTTRNNTLSGTNNQNTDSTQKSTNQNTKAQTSNPNETTNNTQVNTNAPINGNNTANRSTNNRGNIDTMKRAPNIDTFNSTTNDYGVDYNRNRSNNYGNNFNTNGNFNNYNTNQNFNNNANSNYNASNSAASTVAADEYTETTSILSTYEGKLSDENNQLKSQCETLKQNIKSIREITQNNANYTTTQQKALRAYNRVLNSVAHKLSKSQMELLNSSSRLYILASDQTNNADLIDAQILELKSIMSTQVALYECANQALTQIKQFVLGDTASSQNDNNITAGSITQQTAPNIQNNQNRKVANNTSSTNQNTMVANGMQNQLNPVENNKKSNQTATFENSQTQSNNQQNFKRQSTTQNNENQPSNLTINSTMPKLPSNE